MRVSIDENDPGYGPAARDVRLVMLNDQPVRGVVTADDEIGEVLAYVYGADGRPVVDRDHDCFVLHWLKGKVEIITRVH